MRVASVLLRESRQQGLQEGLEKGRQEGRQEVRREVARNMLKDGTPVPVRLYPGRHRRWRI
ncbi:MAG: hypothetical protein AAF471_04685 [Myxococcota bacterium]